MQAGETEEEEIKQQHRMKLVAGMMEKMKASGTVDAKKNGWCFSELLAASCKKSGSTQYWRIRCSNGVMHEKKKDEGKGKEDDHKLASRMISRADGGAGFI